LSSFRNKIHEAPFVGPSWYVAGGWLAVALVLQATLLHYIAIRGVQPSAVLVAVVWYAIRVDSRRAAAYGLLAGLCEDMLATHTGGAWTISTTLVAIIAGALSRGFFADSVPLVASLTAVATLVRYLFFWIVMGFEGYPSGLATLHFHEAVAQGIFNAALMIVVMMVVRRYETQFA
jgi:rod shape-determining protein MreD